MSKTVLTGLLMAIPFMASSQSQHEAQLHGAFVEFVYEAPEIAGARLLGFARSGPISARQTELDVSATLPEDWTSPEVCLRMTTVDGLYESRNTYSVVGVSPGGRLRFPYPTQQLPLLREAPPDTLAGLLTPGACDRFTGLEEAAAVYFGTQSGEALSLFLNTSDAEFTYVMFPQLPDVGEQECRPVTQLVRSAFDTICEIPEAVARQGRLAADVLSVDGGEMVPPVQFVLRVASVP
ncbi:hypothetical protein J4E08_10720 [Sagittula sp. NFXS13]|uniref:hypothetical protein n=1 Tax=Sagittula sp. NFXS13 TaxID=2819095 RepID=UPI0032DFA80D